MKENTEKKKETAETLTTTADDCDDVLAFLKYVAVKSPHIIDVTLYLRVDRLVTH